MEIKVRSIPKNLKGITESEESIAGFYKNLALIIQGSVDFSDAKDFVPIVFTAAIENVGKRFLVLGNGEMISEEPILISLISKNGEPFVDWIKRGEVVAVLTDELKKRFGKEVDVEIEFINEAGLFLYINSNPMN